MNDPELFANLCAICKKNKAEKLCDFVVAYINPCTFRDYLQFKNQMVHETCDLPMCEDCATNHIYFDFCPYHEKLLLELQLPNESHRRAQMREKFTRFEKG